MSTGGNLGDVHINTMCYIARERNSEVYMKVTLTIAGRFKWKYRESIYLND